MDETRVVTIEPESHTTLAQVVEVTLYHETGADWKSSPFEIATWRWPTEAFQSQCTVRYKGSTAKACLCTAAGDPPKATLHGTSPFVADVG